jgi:cell fate regulator YaaT (PSP1 superfamily)
MYSIIYSFLTQETFSLKQEKDHQELPPESIVIYSVNNEGEEAGIVRIANSSVARGEVLDNAYILRKASKNDLQKIEQIELKSQKAKKMCIEKIKKYNLEMQIVSAKYSFDSSKLEFTFLAPARIDFRDLLKELVQSFKTKIRLKQIGPRDKAKLVTGYGKCGRYFCCCSYLEKMPTVTMDAARKQNIAHKSTDKLSGGCGKLLCCLNYEIELYDELKKEFPSVGDKIKYQQGQAEVLGVDFLNNKIKIQIAPGETIVISKEEIA